MINKCIGGFERKLVKITKVCYSGCGIRVCFTLLSSMCTGMPRNLLLHAHKHAQSTRSTQHMPRAHTRRTYIHIHRQLYLIKFAYRHTHTHTHTHTRAPPRTHARTHARAHTHTHTHVRALTLSHKHRPIALEQALQRERDLQQDLARVETEKGVLQRQLRQVKSRQRWWEGGDDEAGQKVGGGGLCQVSSSMSKGQMLGDQISHGLLCI